MLFRSLLQLAIGSAAVSLGLLLAAYMGGLCIGSWLFARKVPATFHPMRAYAYIEGSVALLGVVALFAVPLIGKVYAAGITTGLAGIVWRGVIAALCLLPPTILMGCSFPALARMLDATEEGSSRLGAVYSANIEIGRAHV